MNWKKVRLRNVLVSVLPLGAAAGAWAAFLAEGALILSDLSGVGWLRTYLPVLVLGAVFSGLFAPIDEILNRHRQRALRAVLYGAVLGGIAVTLTYSAYLALTPAGPGLAGESKGLPIARWIGFALGLAVAAACAALASGLAAHNLRLGLRRAVTGVVAGAALGLPLALAGNAAGGNSWVLLGGLTLWGAWLALAIFWFEQRQARRWLRILTGGVEDRFYPLRDRRITVGKSEFNDLPLPRGQEVYPRHCEIKWSNDHYDIVDDEQGGIVLVNFRQIQEHALKPGDLVKIGSVLLQYGEGRAR
jgi:hypothetical protein